MSEEDRYLGRTRYYGFEGWITKELIDIINEPMEGISAGPFGSDLFQWQALITGPPGTPYEEGSFNLAIRFPPDYPFKPPKVVFTTRIFHTNIDRLGNLSLDILRERWIPALTISKVLLSVRCLLEYPNPDDPLVPDLAHMLKSDPVKYDKLVREMTRKYATSLVLEDSISKK